MEKRRDSLSALKLCRFCLSQDGSLTSIYDRSLTPKSSVNLPLKILSCISVEVFPSDKMPCFICKRCKYFMELCHEYKQICRQADETILQYVQSGTPVESIVWPPSLVKCFRENVKSQPSEPKVIKTVVEGGATVQVTSQAVSDSDDDIADVFNIKIDDGSKRAKSNTACIKVISKGDDLEITKEKSKQKKGFSSPAKLTRHVKTHADDRPYPCKYCSKSFMKSHHYTRHVRIKHRENIRTARGPFGQGDPFRCEQCEDCFATQDELIYHSAIHATQNLICPLCQEKFESVDAVTAHIKTHVNGTEFMCELCELVFTSQEKLEKHLVTVHEEELRTEQDEQDESSIDIDLEEDDDNDLQVKEEDDHMVVEIKKPNNYMLSEDAAVIKAINTTVSEESESETTLTAMPSLTAQNKNALDNTPEKTDSPPEKNNSKAETSSEHKMTASILRKAEEIKRKVVQITQNSTPAKTDKSSKPESSNGAGASEKSLRLLEKELQDLKRTSSKEPTKTNAKPMESLKSRKPQVLTSTPKAKPVEEKKAPGKTPAVEKKQPDKRTVMTKENKEPKEKEVKSNNNSIKEDKEVKTQTVVKNGVKEKRLSEDGVRRSTRPSKIKDYAKLIRDSRSQVSEDEDDTDEDEEYQEPEKTPDNRKSRRFSIKTPKNAPASPAAPTPPVAPTPPPAPTPTASAGRKRGRPRKEIAKPTKLKKVDTEEEELHKEAIENDEKSQDQTEPSNTITAENMLNLSPSKAHHEQNLSPGDLMSPSGQTLKKVPIKSLPPGVKPLPLPTNSRPISGELCEMQIGKKVVKVQKIVMTKAEVEAMAKKGLVEMKDGTMVLKQGIKLPSNDPQSIKSTLFGEDVSKESPSKKDKGAPTRCDLEEET